MRATVEKQKIYEITKPQIISLRDRRHGSRIALIGLKCIRTASAIAGDDNHYD
jgi:hypothetical protein